MGIINFGYRVICMGLGALAMIPFRKHSMLVIETMSFSLDGYANCDTDYTDYTDFNIDGLKNYPTSSE